MRFYLFYIDAMLSQTPSKFDPLKRRSSGKERGFTLVLFAVSALVLLAFAGLAIDTGYMLHQKRKMQNAADAAALAAAQELHRGNTSTYANAALTDSRMNGFTNGSNDTSVTVNRPPTNGTYAGNSNYVQVAVSQPQPTFFMSMFNFSRVPMSARATAFVGGAAGGGCITLLHPSFDGSYYTSGGSTVAADCGMWVNSNSTKAIENQGNSAFTSMGTAIHVVGGVNNQGSITPTPITRSAAAPDPLASMQVPSSSGLAARTTPATITGNVTLNPGLYTGGINIGANANVTLNPGLYYMRNGGVYLTKANLSGSGVTMFFTGTQNKTVVLADTLSTINLTAPTSSSNGAMEGVLFFGDRNSNYGALPWCMDIQTNGATSLEGVLYFPTCSIKWQSQSSGYLGNYTIIVAQYLRIDGSGTNLKIHANYSGLANGSPLSSSVKLSE